MRNPPTAKRILLRLATPDERENIYRLRHDVYACELGQHAPNRSGTLSDALDESNVYLVAIRDGTLAGFVSLTPPAAGRYSVDQYLRRQDFASLQDGQLHEVRLLTVVSRFRGREIASVLMYAALRWIRSITRRATHKRIACAIGWPNRSRVFRAGASFPAKRTFCCVTCRPTVPTPPRWCNGAALTVCFSATPAPWAEAWVHMRSGSR